MSCVRWVAVVSNGELWQSCSNSMPWRAAAEGAARLMYYTGQCGMGDLMVQLRCFEDEVEVAYQPTAVNLRTYMESFNQAQLKDAINAVAWSMGSAKEGKCVISELKLMAEKMHEKRYE